MRRTVTSKIVIYMRDVYFNDFQRNMTQYVKSLDSEEIRSLDGVFIDILALNKRLDVINDELSKLEQIKSLSKAYLSRPDLCIDDELASRVNRASNSM